MKSDKETFGNKYVVHDDQAFADRQARRFQEFFAAEGKRLRQYSQPFRGCWFR